MGLAKTRKNEGKRQRNVRRRGLIEGWKGKEEEAGPKEEKARGGRSGRGRGENA